ncbi:MAG TPA: radical SAM protein [Phycisphaerae bacterium]|nr:radical SAM protein [Phycisphaerae bacterium]
MSPPDLMPLTAVGILITNWCPARCRHCYVCSSPERREWMTVETATGHLAALARMGVPAKGIHIGGGEPFGDFERALTIVRAAQDVGLAGVGFVETNGFWATSEPQVRQRLAELREAGMMKIHISADPYHQEFVPAERVRLLHEVARDVLGPDGVRARRWKWLQRPQDVAALPEGERQAFFARFLRHYPERMAGRAARCLAPLAERTPIDALPDDGCRAAVLESGRIHVDPDGWVYPGTCAGIALGRATADVPLDDLLGAWRLDVSPLIARLVAGGPKRLLPDAANGGFRPDPAGYAGTCHLCWSVRRHLVEAGGGGDDLQPEWVYAAL